VQEERGWEMTKEQLAEILNGRSESDVISREEIANACGDGLVVVYGYSDDNVELRGAIDEEIGAWDGTTLYFNKDGLLENKCGDDDCPYYVEQQKTAKTIEAISDFSGKGEYCWTYKTDIPHATFDLMDHDGEGKFCKGIVFDISDLAK
jgi:hypothetical protein